MQEYTIHPLAVGINVTDQGVMTYLRDYGKRILLPIYVFYIKGGSKNILIDTGLEQFIVPDGPNGKSLPVYTIWMTETATGNTKFITMYPDKRR